MSHTNTNLRSLRDQSQQQDQRHDVSFQCIHCGKAQTLTLLLQSSLTKEVTPSPLYYYDTQCSTRSVDEENPSSPAFRQISVINEKPDELTIPELHRSNYSLNFRSPNDENNSKAHVEQNIKSLIDGCVRSSLSEVAYVRKTNKSPQSVIEVEVEYDPILGNVTSTRKRSSTITTNLDEDYKPKTYRLQSANNRQNPFPINSENDDTPIWARRRISHSTVKPSDLVREYDKKEKLQSKALRRLSRTDLAGEGVVPNSTPRPKMSAQNPAMIKDTILRWCQDLTQFYKGVNIRNFSSSWSDGLAFCAIVHRYFPDEFNFDTLNANEPHENFELAFTVALERAGIEPLIDVDDMILMGDKPDWKVVFTYVQSLYRHLSRMPPPAIMRERW